MTRTAEVAAVIIDTLESRGPSGLHVIRKATRAPRSRIDEALSALLDSGAVEAHKAPSGAPYWKITPTPEGNES